MALTLTIAAKFRSDMGSEERNRSFDETDEWNEAIHTGISFAEFIENRVESIAFHLGWDKEEGFIEWAGYDTAE